DACRDGRLVPIVMDAGLEVRPPFKALSHQELVNWAGDETTEFMQIWDSVRDLVVRGGGVTRLYVSLADNPWVLQQVTDASQHLRKLANGFRSINEVLVANTPPVQDLREAFKQVMDTYRVVIGAVQRFTVPALKPGVLDPQPYLDLAH